MTSRIDITAPATITVLSGGSTLSSLDSLPPYAITVSDPDAADTVTLTVVAGNEGAVLSVGSASGASVIADGSSLTVTGSPAEVSAALTSLSIAEPVGVATDTLELTAADPAVLPDMTAIAVDIFSPGNPAFAAPPSSAAVTPNGVTALPGLVLGDPGAAALAAMGLGNDETLQIRLQVGAGVLLLPGFSALSGISAVGLGTGTVVLSFTAGELGSVNALLAQLTYAGPGQTSLTYSVTDISGPLGAATSSGAITLNASGAPGADGTYALGSQTLILGTASIATGTVLDVTGTVADLGGVDGGPVWVASGAALEVPGGAISLSGTSYDFGLLSADGLTVSGSAFLAEAASFGNTVSVAALGLVDFAETLTSAEVSLAANARLTGDGTLLAGTLTGPGTLIAEGGDTLLVAADVSGGAQLDVAGGGVLVLGTDSIAASVTLGFLSGTGAVPDVGGYADSLAQSGGVIVIDDPQAFSGTITGFAGGDRLVFPGLTGLTVSDVTSNSFEITGMNSANAGVTYTIDAAIPAGATLVAGVDAEGGAEISLRAGGIEVAVGGGGFNTGSIDASAGIAQDILGLQLLLPGWTSQSLTLTLSAGHGVLTDGSLSAASALVLTAASPAALNELLAELEYTASISTTLDTLTVSSNTGLLAGLDATIPITIKPAGTVAGFSPAPTAGQTALFAGALTLVTAPAAPGKILVTGAADFADALIVGGIGGTSLLIDAGGSGVFDAASEVWLGGNVTVGDAGGAGTLGVATDGFEIGTLGVSSNLVIAASSLAAQSVVEVTGGLTVSGALLLGESAAARLDLSGKLEDGATTIDAAGILTANGDAAASFGGLVDAGTLILTNDVQADAANLILTGQLQLGGQSALTGLSSAIIGGAGSLLVGPGAAFEAGELNALGGNISVAGSLKVTGNLVSEGSIVLSGGTLGAAAATLGSGGVLSGFGEVVLGLSERISAAGGDIVASGGLLVLDGNLTMSNGGSAVIAGSAALELLDGAGGMVVFEGAGSELIIGNLALDSAAVSGMIGQDVIDLVGVAPSLVSYTGGVIGAEDAGGNAIGAFTLGVVSGQPAVEIVSDGSGGTLVTLGDEMACFARGTRLLTPNGYRPVEDFKPGDPIITRTGAKKPVRWIGCRVLEIGQGQSDMRPVCVLPGALGPGIPGREVWLSPSHAVFLDGVLVPVMHLVNGATIRRVRKAGRVTYYHIELDRHEVVLADGLPVETYLDTGNRGQFHQETGLRGNAVAAYAKLVTGGAQLARLRRRLHEIAIEAGFTMVRIPALRGMVQDLTLLPEMLRHPDGELARFSLPPDAGRMMLIAQTAAPADTDPESDDRRELAICLRPPADGGERFSLGVGWYPLASDDAGIWMSGGGELLIPPGVTELTLHLAAVVQSWRAPVAGRLEFPQRATSGLSSASGKGPSFNPAPLP